MLMKKIYLLFILQIAVFNSNAQTSNSRTLRDWTFVTEKLMVDIFYRILECNNKRQLHLKVFNDLPKDREIIFSVEIGNTKETEKITKKILLNAIAAARYVPDCISTDTLNNLKIDLPAHYNITELTIKAIFPQ